MRGLRLRWTALLVATVAVFFLGLAGSRAQAQTFPDVRPSDHFYAAVEALTELHVLAAQPGASFAPYEPETRADFAYSIAGLLHLDPVYNAAFNDVAPTDWFAGAVGALYEAGLVLGNEDGGFHPDAELSRQQAASLLMRAYAYGSGAVEAADPSAAAGTSPSGTGSQGRGAEGTGVQEPGARQLGTQEAGPGLLTSEDDVALWLAGFKDRAFIASQHRAAVANAYRLGIVSGFDDGRFYPFLNLTRGQAAVILYGALFLTPVPREQPPDPVTAEDSYPTARVGTRGPLVGWLEHGLANLSYLYQPGVVDGVFDKRTREAVMAFQKVEGLERTGSAGAEVWTRLVSAERPLAQKYAPGIRLEIDLTKQVLLFVVNSVVEKTVPVATGRSGWRTPTGTFSAERKLPYWRQSKLGLLYKPVYFRGGYAIHGSYSVPPYPASHGCVRVSVATMDVLYPLIPLGARVDVYY